MDARKGNIFEILNGNRQFIVPVYQRYYSWEISQWDRLWNDIVNMQNNNKKGHFVGSIVNIAEEAMPTGVQKFMIIDGQQRITTLTILLVALKDYGVTHPDDTSINARRINEMLLKNIYEEKDKRYKLLLTETDREVLINLIEDKPNKLQTKSRIIDSYNYFKNQIGKTIIPVKEVYESIGKLQIVNITLDRLYDDPQAIFESLNSTGKELSQCDLIRNYILMDLDEKEQTYIYENLWRPMELLFDYDKQELLMDKFFRDYLTMELIRIPNINKVYDEFKNYYVNCKFNTISEVCTKLYNNAKNYTDMILAKGDEYQLIPSFEDIQNLKMDVVYPFLLKVFSDYKKTVISINEFIEIMDICISYVLRRNICGIATNSLNKTFATLNNNIDYNNYLTSLKVFFVTKKDYKLFPSDEMFKNAFVIKDIYNIRNRNFILNHFENYENKGPINIANYTIEHIMPQNENLNDEWKASLGMDWEEVHNKYLNTIGNLTLTAYNSEMSDKSFTEKMNMKGGFKKSALRINGSLVTLNDWNEKAIIDRANVMAEKASEIWSFPKVSNDEIKYYANSTKEPTAYSLENHLKKGSPQIKEIFLELKRRIIELNDDIEERVTTSYIAYRLSKSFVEIHIGFKNLVIYLRQIEYQNTSFTVDKIPDSYLWTMNRRIYLDDISKIDEAIKLIEKSYNDVK